MFSKEESELLDAAYQIFVGRTHVFNVFSEIKWSNTGIENWVQTEYIVGLGDRGYDVFTVGKLARDCDLIVKKGDLNVGIELGAITSHYYPSLINRIRRHFRADLYLFLFKASDVMLERLDDYYEKNGYVKKYRPIGEWAVMLVKRRKK